MKDTISLPTRRDIRIACGPNVGAWARERGHAPAAVHNTITRYASRDVDLTRVWGEGTRRILVDIHKAVRGAGREEKAA